MRAYVEQRTAKLLSKREIIRCLKRYIAREIYNNLPPSSIRLGLRLGQDRHLTDIGASGLSKQGIRLGVLVGDFRCVGVSGSH
ncbi:hypothetical protein GCM10009616_00630 [Microlunatus lacustris]